MTDYFAQLPNTHTLDGAIVRAVEGEDGERLYLIRMRHVDGTITNYVTTQAGMEHIRQEAERAMLSAMFG